MDLTNFITSIIFAFLDTVLIEYYLNKSFSQKYKSRTLQCIIELILLSIINSDIIGSAVINTFLLFGVLILSVFKCNLKFKEIIKYILIFFSMKIIVENALYIMFSFIFDTTINTQQFHWIISYRILIMSFFRYLEFIIIIYFLNKKLNQKIQLHYFKVISIAFSIYFSIAIIMNNDKLFYFPSIGRTFIFVIVVYNIALVMFDRYQRKAEQLEKDFLITKQNIELEKHYIKDVGEVNNQIRAFRHDFKNRVTIISGLIQKNLTTEAIAQLEEILGETLDLTVAKYVDNVYVDTAIDSKVKVIKNKGYEFNETYGLISIGNICAADLALAVALAMDNAIEAVENIKDAKQMISLDIRTNKNYIIMTLSNSIQPGAKVQFSRTSKTEQTENHGFGVKKIKSIAEDYDGDAKYEVYNDRVTLKLFMSISKGIEKEKA